jgi:uncharacterized protein (TIGR00369 family)
MSGVTVEEFRGIIRDSLPFAAAFGADIVEMGEGRAVAVLPFKSDFLRPGGTIGGPLLMMLADLVLYAAVLSRIGRVELAVTTNLTINFLRKPPPTGIRAEAKLLKLGSRLAIGEVALYSDDHDEIVAHVVATYSIPPRDHAGLAVK